MLSLHVGFAVAFSVALAHAFTHWWAWTLAPRWGLLVWLVVATANRYVLTSKSVVVSLAISGIVAAAPAQERPGLTPTAGSGCGDGRSGRPPDPDRFQSSAERNGGWAQ